VRGKKHEVKEGKRRVRAREKETQIDQFTVLFKSHCVYRILRQPP
jgi:hypothetical protein